MQGNNKNPYNNAEGYSDPTAYYGCKQERCRNTYKAYKIYMQVSRL